MVSFDDAENNVEKYTEIMFFLKVAVAASKNSYIEFLLESQQRCFTIVHVSQAESKEIIHLFERLNQKNGVIIITERQGNEFKMQKINDKKGNKALK